MGKNCGLHCVDRKGSCQTKRYGRFSSLEEKVEMVKRWPGVSERHSEADLWTAVEQAGDIGLLDRFEEASKTNALLDLVITMYLGSVVETFLFGLERFRESVGARQFKVTNEVYKSPELASRLSLFPGVVAPKNTIKIEMIDLGAYYSPVGYLPKDMRNVKLAHAQVLFAAAQNRCWVCQMNPADRVPYALIGGYQLKVPTKEAVPHAPYFWLDRQQGIVEFGVSALNVPCYGDAMPVVRL